MPLRMFPETLVKFQLLFSPGLNGWGLLVLVPWTGHIPGALCRLTCPKAVAAAWWTTVWTRPWQQGWLGKLDCANPLPPTMWRQRWFSCSAFWAILHVMSGCYEYPSQELRGLSGLAWRCVVLMPAASEWVKNCAECRIRPLTFECLWWRNAANFFLFLEL